MTSKTSLSRPFSQKHAAVFSFKSTFTLGLTAINAAVLFMIMFMPLDTAEILTSWKVSEPNPLYSLLPPSKNPTLIIILVIQAMAVSAIVFGFMTGKRSSAAYLSLPISRRRLFWTRYAAGLISLFVPSIVYMTYQLIINIQVFGYTGHLIQAYLLILGALLVMLFSVYSITSAICLCVGTIVEGMVFSLVVIFCVQVILFCVSLFCMHNLHGNTYGETTGSYAGISWMLNDYINPFHPVTYSMWINNIYGTYFGEADTFIIPFWGSYARPYGSASIILWFSLSSWISFGAYKAFKNYKAENSGVYGFNKRLGFITTFIAVIAAYAIVYDSRGPALLFSLIAFCACRFLLTLDLKKILSRVRQYFAALTAVFIIIALLGSGMLGYSSYQPSPYEIEWAYITYTGSPDFIIGSGNEASNYQFTLRDKNEQNVYVREFTDMLYTAKSDIDVVLGLHKELIDAGQGFSAAALRKSCDNTEIDRLKMKVYVFYKLKNGKSIGRLYKSVPTQTVLNMLILDDTELVSERIAASMHSAAAADFDTVVITDSLFENKYTLNPTDNQKLFAALLDDINSLTSDEKYFPRQNAHVVISFPRLSPDNSNSQTLYAATGNNNRMPVSALSSSPAYQKYDISTANMRLYITGGYTNTINFLKSKGIYDAIHTAKTDLSAIQAMYVEKYRLHPNFHTLSPYFRAYVSGNYTVAGVSLEIGQNRYADILNLSRNNYYTAKGGYLVKVLTMDTSGTPKWTTLFLPESDAPDYIKERF